MAASIQERLKLKRLTVDVWSTKEKLALAWAVQRSGDQNWSCVSRTIKPFAEKYRPADWFSPKNCAQQYAALLENVETPKRKKRSTGSTDRAEVETPGEYIVRVLNDQHLKNLDDILIKNQQSYLKGLEELNAFVNGELDHMIPQFQEEIEEKKKKEERKEKARADWLRDREKKKRDLESKLKLRPLITPLRRESSMSDPSSDADSPFNDSLSLAVDVAEETLIRTPVAHAHPHTPTPTSPLLTSLLKSPPPNPSLLPPPASPATSILHSAITSPLRGVSPTIASLLNSSPGHSAPIGMAPGSVSPNLKSLVSSALGNREEVKTLIQSPSQGAPTLSMLLELPPSMPGKPLPVLQVQPPPQPSAPAPPPYTDRLGPPPPYSLATEYLQKQRAEQAYQAQIAIRNVEKELLAAAAIVAPPHFPTIQTNEPIDLDDIEEVIADETRQFKTDHDYIEPKEETQAQMIASEEAKVEKKQLDVFEFGEEEETENVANISYAKSNAKRLAKKFTSPAKNSTTQHVLSEDDFLMGVDDSSPVPEEKEDELLEEETVESEVCGTEEGELLPVESTQVSVTSSPVKEAAPPEPPVEAVEVCIKEEVKQGTEEGGDIKKEEPPEVVVEVEQIVQPPAVTVTPKEEEKVVPEPPAIEDEKSSETAELSVANINVIAAIAATSSTPASLKRRRGTAATSDSIPSSPVSFNEEEKEYRTWKKQIVMVLGRIEGHKSASLFLKPINDDQAPDYSSIVFKPMDLSTIKRNIEAGIVRSTAEFQRDVLIMFLNARMFNKANDVIYEQTMIMQEDSLKHIQIMMESRGEAEASEPSRRETRTHDKSGVAQSSRTSRSSIKPAIKRQRLSSDGPRKKQHVEET